MRFRGFRSAASLCVVGVTALGVTACSEEAVFGPDVSDSAETVAMTQLGPGLVPRAADASSAAAGEREPNFQLANGPVAGLNPLVTLQGQISLSLDGMGTLGPSGMIQVDKPAGATVGMAILFSATIPSFAGETIPDGTISLGGTPVNWDDSHAFAFFGGFFTGMSYHADVTSIVAPIVDAAPAGLVDIDVVEGPTSGVIDGEILAVIFDDPNQTTENTVALLFGGQKVEGDQFFISLADPIDTGDPPLALDMSLGISFGKQPSLPRQFSVVDVNGMRLTRSAGGQDDGIGMVPSNGALITVGGIGDSNDNPPNPNAFPFGPRSDDELYSLLPFVEDSDQLILVETDNPSDDDNIFVAAFFLTVEAQVTTTEPPSNEPPTAVASVAEMVECAGDATTVDLDGSGSTDNDGAIVSWQWFEGADEIATGEVTTVDLSLGTHAITLRVTDGEGATDEVEVTVEIEDTTPPELAFEVEPDMLWPPNHKMRQVVAGQVSDACHGTADLTFDVTSNEAINDRGDGNTEPDWDVGDNGDGTFVLFVRAERDGRRTGRVYTIEVTATDASGNEVVATAEVTVAHDQAKK
jgi:hypothetical protein